MREVVSWSVVVAVVAVVSSTAIFNSRTEIVSIPPAATALDKGTNSSRPPSINDY